MHTEAFTLCFARADLIRTMKVKMNVSYLISNGNRQLVQLNCSGMISSNGCLHSGDEVWFQTSTDDEQPADHKIERVTYDLIGGVLKPEVFLKEITNRNVADGIGGKITEEKAVRTEMAHVEEWVIPALKKAGFTSFEWAADKFVPNPIKLDRPVEELVAEIVADLRKLHPNLVDAKNMWQLIGRKFEGRRTPKDIVRLVMEAFCAS